MHDRASKLIGLALAAGQLLNGTVGLLEFLRGTPAEAQGAGRLQGVYLCDERGKPLRTETLPADVNGRSVLSVRAER